MHDLSRGMREPSHGICLLQPQDYRRMPWKNGLGMTTELAVSPVGAGLNDKPFDWRVSIAEVENDCEFSRFPGYDRSIMLIEGAGMELSFDSSSSQRIDQTQEPFRFSGECLTRCRLLDGPVRDFNVICARTKFALSCEVLTSPALLHWEAHSEILLIYCLQSRLGLEGIQDIRVEISTGYTLILDKRTDIPADHVLKMSALSEDMVAIVVRIRSV